MTSRHNFFSALLVATGILLAPAPALAAEWSFHGQVVAGGQFDAVRGPDDNVHLVSSVYAQFDASGALLLTEAQGDGWQGDLDFPPAIAAGLDGTIHLVTRHGGNYENGHDIRYRRRNEQGTWDRDYVLGPPISRNYRVGVASAGGNVYIANGGHNDDFWGPVRLYQADANAATLLGQIPGVSRHDAGHRMRSFMDRVVFVAGRPDPNGTAFISFGTAGPGLADELASNLQAQQAGTGRRGFPSLSIDAEGQTHLTYGAFEAAYYIKFDADGNKVVGDVEVFTGLGGTNLSVGYSEVVATDDGQKVLAVAMRNDDDDDHGTFSELLWASSEDGGASWSAPEALGRTMNSGDGRHRPRLVAVGNEVLMFFAENNVSGVSLATIDLALDLDSDGFDEDDDCNDQDMSVHPDATELCNGQDDNCDKQVDEGCSCVDGDIEVCGVDIGECQTGTRECTDGSWGPCAGELGPVTEICEDNLDNDCDNAIDEGCGEDETSSSTGSDTDSGTGSDTDTDSDTGADTNSETGNSSTSTSAGSGPFVGDDGFADDDTEGCSCRSTKRTGSTEFFLLLVLAGVFRRRNRREP
ncbi:MAG: MopE-related protein [Nannocystaceae bacterium]